MSTRPEIIFPLFSALTVLDGVGPKIAKNFENLGITRPRDLLLTLPYSGIKRDLVSTVQGAEFPNVLTVQVTVGLHKAGRTKSSAYRVQVEDQETTFQLVFFHARGDYLKKMLPVGATRIVSGKVELFDGVAQMVHPEYMIAPEDLHTIPKFEPIYPLTAGVTQKTMVRATRSAVTLIPDLAEWIDPPQKQRAGWPDWQDAVRQAHEPASLAEMSATNPRRERLAYDEFFAHQLTLSLARAQQRRAKGRVTQGAGDLRQRLLAALPYDPTGAIAVEDGGQGVLMAPTEILARQHLEALSPLAEDAQVVIELLTGRDKGRERREKLAALARGDIHILIGTHAVFQSDVEFQDLRLAIIDEQHRFGVRQRMELGQKGEAVDVLVMTATPIPRSLALAQYGDMDVSILDEKPPGRKPISTAVVSLDRIDEVIAKLRHAIAEGKQAYWVCPLVEESEVLDYTSAEDRFKRLRAALGEGVVELVHGQMPNDQKDAAMARFQQGEAQVLVATTVIEVGVNVPTATIMVIERAESFGLAQLHQLRGRVGRGSDKSTCLLLYKAPLSETGRRRLEVLRETEDGFRISEVDLQMRGAGDLIGTAQSGIPRFRIADMESMSSLMATAQSDARKLINDDPNLTSPRGEAARVLLWLMDQDQAIRLISVG
ncbi:MAG: ATP-dependent DNA helicase RecG [Rhodobacteraceae bacterium]|nr:ATP-dependent DNA helicase RecG [Paracoccaceae bacterium]